MMLNDKKKTLPTSAYTWNCMDKNSKISLFFKSWKLLKYTCCKMYYQTEKQQMQMKSE